MDTDGHLSSLDGHRQLARSKNMTQMNNEDTLLSAKQKLKILQYNCRSNLEMHDTNGRRGPILF